jgi:hypothetical protein
MIIKYDLTLDVQAIARMLGGGARFVCHYSTPAWIAELTTSDGSVIDGRGPTAAQAIVALGRRLRRPE